MREAGIGMRNAAVGMVLFVATTFAAQAQQLWGASSLGMSVDEVKAAVPGAVAPANPSTLGGGGGAAPKAIELLRLEPVEIAGKPFQAKFYFAGEKLSQVTLTLQEKSNYPVAMLTFDSLMDALKVKYGTEISRKSQRGMLNMTEANWIAGKTNINMLLMSVGSADAVLNINYQVRLAAEAGKL